jgi:hypothetical protein
MDHTQTREMVLAAAREGRATYLPAGARDNDTALIFVDGKEVGQASVVGHYVVPVSDARTFGERALQPGPAFTLPERLR